MVKHTWSNDPFLNRVLVGFDEFLNQVDNTSVGNYPPYNLIKIKEDNYQIDVACTGFDENEIEVTLEQGQKQPAVVVTAKKTNTETDERTFTHRGLSTKDFTKTFLVPQYVEVQGVWLKNGVLSVELVRNLPDAVKPKVFKPNSNPEQLNG